MIHPSIQPSSQTIHLDGLAGWPREPLVFLGALYRPKSLGDLGLYITTCKQAGSRMAHSHAIRMVHPDGLAESCCEPLGFLGAVYRPDSLGDLGLYSYGCTQAVSTGCSSGWPAGWPF